MADKLWIWLAWHLPRRIVYWATIRVFTHEPQDMTADEFAAWELVPARRIEDALRLWEKPS